MSAIALRTQPQLSILHSPHCCSWRRTRAQYTVRSIFAIFAAIWILSRSSCALALMAFSAAAGRRFNVTAGGFGLRAERRKVSSSKAGETSARLGPQATWCSLLARCVDVSAEAPAFGTSKKVSGHHGFNWSMCAASPSPEENEPNEEPEDEEPGDEEPGDEKPTSDKEIWYTDEDPDLTTNGTANLSGVEDFKKRKLEIYGEYVSEDIYGDDKWLAREMSRIYTEEYYKEPVEQAEAMEVVGKLEELYSKPLDAGDQVQPDVVDYAFHTHLLIIFVIAGLAAFVGVYSKPLGEQLNALLPMIKKAFAIFFYSTLKYSRYNK